VYGSRQDPSSPYSGVITKFIDRGTRGEPITIYGDGLQTRSFINVKNIAQYNVRAIEMLSEKRMEWASINLGHPKTTSICDLAEMINSSLKTSVQIVHLDKISGDIRHSTPDLHLNRKIFGYVDLISLRDGIEKLVEKSQ
jgi:UDP-glucose 4-epimerase